MRYDVRMHTDATGRPISKGAYIAYVVTTGSSAGVKFGAVVRLKEKTVKRNQYDQQTQTWSEVEEQKYSIQVISVDKPSWGPNKDKWIVQGKSDEENKLARVQSIERLERVIVLEPLQMNPDAKEVLDKELHLRGTI